MRNSSSGIYPGDLGRASTVAVQGERGTTNRGDKRIASRIFNCKAGVSPTATISPAVAGGDKERYSLDGTLLEGRIVALHLRHAIIRLAVAPTVGHNRCQIVGDDLVELDLEIDIGGATGTGITFDCVDQQICSWSLGSSLLDVQGCLKSWQCAAAVDRYGRDGADALSSLDARGAAMGSVGLIVFAIVVRRFLPGHPAWLILTGATVAWFIISMILWQSRAILRGHFLARRH